MEYVEVSPYEVAAGLIALASAVLLGAVLPFELARRRWAPGRVPKGAVAAGGLLLAAALVIQPLLQAVAIAAVRGVPLREVRRVVLCDVASSFAAAAAYSLVLAAVAGFLQEGLKLLAVAALRADRARGLWLGVGFGLAEVVLVFTAIVGAPWAPKLRPEEVGLAPELLPLLAGLLGVERFMATVFHATSASILAASLTAGRAWRAYLLLSAAHTYIDFWGALYQLTMYVYRSFWALPLPAVYAAVAPAVAAVYLWWRRSPSA